MSPREEDMSAERAAKIIVLAMAATIAAIWIVFNMIFRSSRARALDPSDPHTPPTENARVR